MAVLLEKERIKRKEENRFRTTTTIKINAAR